ncbi:Hypothetical predicted protein [Lecanosticta acicola]|uniref:Uncharacterized protein n=1 Tax=Lecanosticta acicola TaxID=111012 RepID=A0AAI8YZ21_9PEZI|nr:Hypothetical predicted protein [Lecanosticta acicola]
MKLTQQLIAAFLAFCVVGMASPIPDTTIVDSPDKAKPYKEEVDAQAAVAKRDDLIVDSPDRAKPYKDEVDVQAAAMRV